MSSSLKPTIQALKADGVLAAYIAVKKGSDENHAIAGSANTSLVFGISQSAATTAEDLIEVAVAGGCKAKLGEGVAKGDPLVSHTDGTLVKPNAANDIIIAWADQDGSTNDVIGVIIGRSMASAAV